MCLVLLWKTRFLVIAIVDILSKKSVAGSLLSCCRSAGILLSHTTSHAALVTAMHSASAEDSAIVACCLDNPEMALGPN